MADKTQAISIFVIEDHYIVRKSLVSLLNMSEEVRVDGEAGDGVEAIQKLQDQSPDVVLVDLHLPRLGGIEVIRNIHEEKPGIRFIVLTTYDGDENIYRALQAGALAYLLKGTTRQELISAIQLVHGGKSYYPTDVARQLANRMDYKDLTRREQDVLEQIAQGKCNKAIATSLHISEATVKTHINYLLNKLNVNDRTTAVMTAVKRGLVSLKSMRRAD